MEINNEKIKLFFSNMIKSRKTLYVILIVFLCAAMLFAGFATGFRGGIHRNGFDREFGMNRNMMKEGKFDKQNEEGCIFKTSCALNNKGFGKQDSNIKCPNINNIPNIEGTCTTNDIESVKVKINDMKNELDLLYKSINELQTNSTNSK